MKTLFPQCVILVLLPLQIWAGDSDSTAGHWPCRMSTALDLPMLGIGIAAAGAGIAVEGATCSRSATELYGLSRERINAFDRGATLRYSDRADVISDLLAAGLLAAPMGLLSRKMVRDNARSFSLMYCEVLLLSYALPALCKGIALRDRPYVYNPAVAPDTRTEADARHSFFSRHATLAFASAGFFSTVFSRTHPGSPVTPWVTTSAFAAAATTGCLRYASGRHFPTDIFTGAMIGSLIGYGIPWMHARRHVRIGAGPNELFLEVAFVTQAK